MSHVALAYYVGCCLPTQTPEPTGIMAISTIPEAIEDLRQGKMIILVDDPSRENEGDLAMLAEHMMDALGQIEGLRLLGETAERAPVFSFVVEGAHAHDLAMILDQDGIAVRSGHHCAHPLLQQLGVSATLRASLGIYNTIEEIDHFAQSLERARRMLVG